MKAVLGHVMHRLMHEACCGCSLVSEKHRHSSKLGHLFSLCYMMHKRACQALPTSAVVHADMQADLQVASYICTLVCLKVETLEQCIAMAASAGGGLVSNADLFVKCIKQRILAELRQWLHSRACGEDTPLPDSCPVLHAEACFDAGSPLAAKLGLLKVRKSWLLGH